MHYLIGDKLRTTYIHEQQFLDAQYNAKQLYVESTSYDRTIMSARA